MVAALRSHVTNQCPVPVAPATVVAPAATVVAEAAVAVTTTVEADPAPAGDAKTETTKS